MAIREQVSPQVIQPPAAGDWKIDAAHSSASFVVRYMMVSKFRGRFTGVSGRIQIAENPKESRVEAVIDAASIDTGMPPRDEHLRGPDFLDVVKFPNISFAGSPLRQTGDVEFEIDGELSIRDIKRPVTLKVTYGGVVPDPNFGARAFFSATTEIDREDFEVSWNQPLEGEAVLVGRKVQIELEITAVPAKSD